MRKDPFIHCLKREIYTLMSLLSIEEITLNKDLIKNLETFFNLTRMS